MADDKTQQRGICVINPATKPGAVSNPPLLISNLCIWATADFSPSGEICVCSISVVSGVPANDKPAQRRFACEKSHPSASASECCNSKCGVADNLRKSFHLFAARKSPFLIAQHFNSDTRQKLKKMNHMQFSTTMDPGAYLVLKVNPGITLVSSLCQDDSADVFVNLTD